MTYLDHFINCSTEQGWFVCAYNNQQQLYVIEINKVEQEWLTNGIEVTCQEGFMDAFVDMCTDLNWFIKKLNQRRIQDWCTLKHRVCNYDSICYNEESDDEESDDEESDDEESDWSSEEGESDWDDNDNA